MNFLNSLLLVLGTAGAEVRARARLSIVVQEISAGELMLSMGAPEGPSASLLFLRVTGGGFNMK